MYALLSAPDFIYRLFRPIRVSGFRLNHEDLLSSVRAPAVIYANGTVECSHPAVYTVSCHINIKNFPLDDQRCSFNVCPLLATTIGVRVSISGVQLGVWHRKD
jgi:hypothetical protein